MTQPRAVVLDMEGVLHVDWQAIDGSARPWSGSLEPASAWPC